MKKLITVLLLLVSMSINAQKGEQLFASISTIPTTKYEPTIKLNLEKVNFNSPNTFKTSNRGGTEIGPALMIAGAGFLIGGLLTSPEQYGLSGKDKKFFENPARAAAVIGGGVVLTTGLIVWVF